MTNITCGLSKNELATIRKILSPYASKLDTVGVFGSRATGQYKGYSDIDVVLYGTINQQETDRLNTLFDDSNLGLRVEVKNYNTVNYPPLKRHIDSVVRVLFTKQQLL